MDMMRIETHMVQTPPVIPHPHHSFQSPHSAFSSWSSSSLSQRGTPRPLTATPTSMMGPPQEMVCQSPVPFHSMHSMNSMNTISPHHRSTPNPEIHPVPYPPLPPDQHFATSSPLSCPIRESPLTLPHNIQDKNSYLESVSYTQQPIFNPPKSQIPAHSQLGNMNANCNANVLHQPVHAVVSRTCPQTSTPTHSFSQTLNNQSTAQFASTTSTSSHPSLESVEFEDSDMNKSSIDESTAKLFISDSDDPPTSMPYSVVVTSIATSSLENAGESISNLAGSPTNLSIAHSSKFPLVKERRVFDKKIRREIANCNERKRMENINNGFKTLKVLLPQSQNEKTSKAAILQQTAKYIQRLTDDKHRLIEENEKLKCELSKYMLTSQFGPGKSSGFIQPSSGFQPFSSQLSGMPHGKPEVEICNKMQEDLKKLQEQLSQERYSKCMLEKRNRDLESRMDFMENVYTQNTDPVLATRESHCKHNYESIVMSLEQLDGDCYPHNRSHTPLSAYERQTPYVEIMDRSTTPYIDRNTPVGHFRAIKSPMPHH